MALTFYYGSGSPYAWRVWLALEHKAVSYELKSVSSLQADLAKRNTCDQPAAQGGRP